MSDFGQFEPMRAGIASLENRISDLEFENERMRNALLAIRKRHEEANDRVGRPRHRSGTLRLVREGLGEEP